MTPMSKVQRASAVALLTLAYNYILFRRFLRARWRP